MSTFSQLGIHQTSSGSSSSSINLNVTANGTAGNLAILAIRTGQAATAINSITDTKSHTWTKLFPLGASNAGSLAVWTTTEGAAPATGPLADSDSVTITANASTIGMSALLLDAPRGFTMESNSGAVAQAGGVSSYTVSATPAASGDIILALIAEGIGNVNPSKGSLAAGWSAGWSTASGDYILTASAFGDTTAGTPESITWNNANSANSSATTAMLVLALNEPVADAGVNQVVAPGETVTLDGSGSASNTSINSYAWLCESGPHANDTLSGEKPTYTATLGTDVWQLTITDANSKTATSTVTVECATNIRRMWDGSEIINARLVTLKPDGTME